ncbi:2,4-dienoyl-CoA reductase-like NADH-dependent reductase (Old Yellow Enzyme family) [Haloferula luteola]|uniref:2,4-dienoyl-CoA reductase-like NADH-dependent reductase (Old Yellow Enzyme family) n=2 Tax=Haloferula luteola TaxID=595692 RepID=A0A840V6J4_9BACT|nr:2,4-dienoyl-CoA reductase-like NADH-dependent reductase (Old Yellow Enzyme family) [Haloferula luteola]
MAPLTRCRTGDERVPNALTAEYYAQRSSAGLIFSEATSVSPRGVGYPGTPGIWSAEQTEGWRQVTDAVHQAGGRISLQLWHVGRISHPSYLSGQLPVAPSAIAASGHVSLIRPLTPFPTPHALTLSEIAATLDDYRTAAANAHAAGFDGVMIHAANGYLIDQFLQDATNHRTDEYGGTLDHRLRFLLEVVAAVAESWESGRIGVHLAPRGDTHDMGDSDPKTLFGAVASALSGRVGYLSAREHHEAEALGPFLKQTFGGPFVANEKFTAESAENALASGIADAVAFGKAFISNPDLPERFARGAELTPPNPATFYFTGEGDPRTGYTDYPALTD